MTSVLITLLFGALLMCSGRVLFDRWIKAFDQALRLGLSGLLGLAAAGLLTFFVGITGLLQYASILIGVCALGLTALCFKKTSLREEVRGQLPGGALMAIVGAAAAAIVMALLVAAGPSDSLDWDSLAYHLAVPKLWLSSGRIDYISFIHHSNFPFLIDHLYILGLQYGGAAGAKSFTCLHLIFGCFAVFGLARTMWSAMAGWWSMLAFVAIPTVLWESGTAYIDVGHGLYAGLGTILISRWIAERTRQNELLLGSVLLGCAAASKFTGLQTLAAVVLVLVLFGIRSKAMLDHAKAAALVVGVSLILASPWLVRNVVNTGNPVYPFFYEVFGGRNWDQFSADIYREEQQTFGVGKTEAGRDKTQIGHAILGLAYQPGRYVNPRQTEGGGFPTGALGVGVLAIGLAWSFSGRLRRAEAATLAVIAISFGAWFLLSQQSRYMLNIAIPLAVLGGGAVTSLQVGRLVAGILAIQALYSLGMVYTLSLKAKLPVVLGQASTEEFHKANGPGFYFASQRLNELALNGKVALYDEVFGFYLDVPYYWANPGHSTEIPYAELENGDQLAAKLNELKFTHVFLNLGYQTPEQRDRWAKAAGLIQGGAAYEGEERAQQTADLRNKWRVLVAEAVRSGRLQLLEQSGGGLIFRLVP